MPSSANADNIIPLLKRIFPNGIAWNGYKKSKLLGLMSKDTKFGSEGKYINVSTNPTEGGSSDYQTAYTNQGPTGEQRFFVGHKTEYQLARIKHIAIAKTMGDRNAIVRIVEHTFSRAGYAFGRALAARVWGDAGGSLFQFASSTSTSGAVITLRNKAAAAKVEKGMWLQFSTDNGTGTSPAGVLDTGKQLQVTKVDVANKQITVSANLNTVSGITTTSYAFRAGDYANTMTGMQGWGPVTDPTGGESFFGVDRTLFMNRLSGYRFSAAGTSKENGLLSALAEGMAHGAEPTTAFFNPLDFNALLQEVGSDRIIDVKTTDPKVGYKGLMIDTPVGDLTCVSEVDVPLGYTWCFDPKDFELSTAGDCPRVLDFDGNGRLMRVQGEDASQFDLGAYGNINPTEDGQGPGGTVIISWV